LGRELNWNFVTKPDGKRPFEIHKHMWNDNINIGLKGTTKKGVGWIDLPQGRDS
jgi:hypothetical protein